MDIILDTNVLASDFHLKSAKFSSLLDHLKKTDGRFVLLEAVRIELLAVYKRELISRLDKARAACNSLGMLIGGKELSPTVSVEKELDLLAKRLDNLKNKVQIMRYTGVVNVAEVVRRGAYRVPPANQKGEELRDVIVWLVALEYATSTNRKTAFITKDKGFWAGETPNEQLTDDLTKAGEQLQVYPDIEAFISKSNVRSAPVDRAWLSKYLETIQLRDLTVKQLRGQLQAEFYNWTMEISLDTLELSRGVAYEVSPNSKFVEFQCDFTASLKVLGSSVSNPVVLQSNLNNWLTPPTQSTMTYSLSPVFVSDIIANPLPVNYTYNFSHYNTVAADASVQTAWVTPSGAPIYFSTYTPPDKIAGTADFTMRILNESMQSVDLDQVLYETGRKATTR